MDNNSHGFMCEPEECREICSKAQQYWDASKHKETSVRKMSDFCKEQTLSFIWESNRLEGTLPEGARKFDVESALTKMIDNNPLKVEPTHPIGVDPNTSDVHFSQLINHLKAFFLLCRHEHSTGLLPPLTEELIQSVHKVMMTGLKTEEGYQVKAGAYREKSVHAGTHIFPSYECIPPNMARIVKEYESKKSSSHDRYQLASWLFYQVVSLHPFEDGNGRLSRLLWCYSLMRDGLPFPLVLTSGHRRSQKHLVQCLEQDRRLSVTGQPNLTHMTIVSVRNAWNCFLKDFSSETTNNH